MTSKQKRDIYQDVTDRIITALEEGVVPWRKPWRNVGGPRNLNSGRAYRGINPFILELESLAQGYTDPRWATFNGMKKAGGAIRKGEHGTRVILWRRITVEDKENPGEKKPLLLLRDYVVFNVEQADFEKPLPALSEPEQHSPHHEAEAIARDFIEGGGPRYREAGDRAFYSPTEDAVTVPKLGQFNSAEAFHSTVFHELVHATGHESRLNRLDLSTFGTEPYAKEELVAEFGAAMLCGMAGLDVEPTTEASAGYIHHWLQSLRDDKKLAISAAGQAQRAADLIYGTTFEEDPTKGGSSRQEESV